MVSVQILFWVTILFYAVWINWCLLQKKKEKESNSYNIQIDYSQKKPNQPMHTDEHKTSS